MKWITRERPKIDRLACPWLLKRFVDETAEFIYVPFDQVMAQAKALGAIPFDVPNVEYTHYEEECTFDYILKKHQLKDPALLIMAKIVRGADTDRHELAKESAGLLAISSGLAYNIHDDQQLLTIALTLYDGLYSWAKYLYAQKHLQNSPFENLLHEVYAKLLAAKDPQQQKTPNWAKELKSLIQDQIDTQLAFNLKDISAELNIHPAYLSRAFSKYFDNLSFGEYIRKMRIEKAITMIETSDYSLTAIAYLTGFSDQSHFNRVFKKLTGHNPSFYRKVREKGKAGTKGN